MGKEEKKFEEFCEMYGKLYSEDAFQTIQNSFYDGSYNTSVNYDIVNQVYSYLDILKCNNPYVEYINYLKECYSIDCHILEVGSGNFPELARRIQLEQKDGSITCYDPNSMFKCFNGIKIHQEAFDESTDVSKYDIIIGNMPCDATLEMIKSANKNDKDLFLNLCGCTHFNFIGWSLDNFLRRMWNDKIIDTMQSTLPSDREYFFEQPDFAPFGLLRTKKK